MTATRKLEKTLFPKPFWRELQDLFCHLEGDTAPAGGVNHRKLNPTKQARRATQKLETTWEDTFLITILDNSAIYFCQELLRLCLLNCLHCNPEASECDSGEIAFDSFVVSGCNPSKFFESSDDSFDDVSFFVDAF